MLSNDERLNCSLENKIKVKNFASFPPILFTSSFKEKSWHAKIGSFLQKSFGKVTDCPRPVCPTTWKSVG